MNKKYTGQACKYCERAAVSRNMCRKHYSKWYKVDGDESKMLTHGNSVPIEERMQDFTPHKTCWLWNKGVTNGGYGKVKFEGRTLGAHVVAWFLHTGFWPESELDHICHTINSKCSGGVDCLHRRCINPDHLEPVGNRENTRRRDIRKGLDQQSRVIKVSKRALPLFCGKGHEYTEDNTRITPKGHRSCRQCAREYTKEWRSKK